METYPRFEILCYAFGMDQNPPQSDELSARREAMRERLRLKADRVLEVVEEMADPKTFLEVERAARAIMVTDKMIIQLFSAPKAVRFDMRFGAEDYDDGECEPSSRLSVERTVEFEAKVENAPSARSARTSPLQAVVDNASKGEDEAVATVDQENSIKMPVSGRLTKRQKRRQRVFESQGKAVTSGVGLSP